jgi:1,4-alpha-glucan branching enzyme
MANSEPTGYLSLVLHAHLPFVRHPEYEEPLEEDWLHEALTETYIPVLRMMEGFERDGVDWRLTMSLTPPLVAMLTDPLLQDRYVQHIERLIELAEKEVERTRFQPEFQSTAQMYLRKFHECRETFVDQYGRNIIKGFRKYQDAGFLEVITCGATHGFLPLMNLHPNAVRAQVAVAAQAYQENFGRRPRGIWNGECGYYPGLDELLKEQAIRYFFVDTHGILFASRRPRYGVFAPIYCPSGVAAFGRDIETGKAVWSAEEGYPGDFRYREFYRDIGYDLPLDYIQPYIHPTGLRMPTGIKYYRITGKVTLNEKVPYSETDAMEAAADHAGNFMFNRGQQIDYLSTIMDRKPLVTACYDAELFGHWWYEGPAFLNYLIRKIHYDQKTVQLITPPEYLEEYPVNQVAVPSYSSWGHKGYAEVWLEGSNDWIYRHLHKAAERMIDLANRFVTPSDLERRALNQTARELLLAQSSDWAFIMKTGTVVDYAVKRTKEHLLRFTDLWEMLNRSQLHVDYLVSLERADNIFPTIDYRVYAG